MKSSILLFVIGVAALSSCTTAYKTGQTPDDVYYSPVPPREEYVQSRKEDDREYRYDEEYYDDRYLRMKVANRYRWNDLNDWYYYERNGFGYNYIYGSFDNPFNSWNYFYNPYCNCCTTIRYNDPKTIRPAVIKNNFNLAGYNNNNYSNSNIKSNIKNNTTRSIFSNQNNNNSNNNSGKGLSNSIRTIFSGNGNNNSGNSGNSGRSYNPSNNNSSSGSSSSGGGSKSSGGGGSVSRPGRN